MKRQLPHTETLFMPVIDAANLLGVSRDTVERAAITGSMRSFALRPGGRAYVLRAAVTATPVDLSGVPEMVRPAHAARVLGVSLSALNHAIAFGTVPHRRLVPNGQRFVLGSWLRDLATPTEAELATISTAFVVPVGAAEAGAEE